MELFTIVDYETDIKTENGFYIEKKEYNEDKLNEFINITKFYYVKVDIESEDTDFNDRYSSNNSFLVACNKNNLLIKDDKLYGFLASGTGRFDKNFIAVSFENNHYNYYDGSTYSYIDKDYRLLKYDFNEKICDTYIKYKIKRESICYRVLGGKEYYNDKYYNEFELTAFDVIVENDEPIGIKYNNLCFVFNDKKSLTQKVKEESKLGAALYVYYHTYSLVNN